MHFSGLFEHLAKSKWQVIHHGKELIFSPDEAIVMEWAAFYERSGISILEAFTTGKPNTMGGIPHDTCDSMVHVSLEH